MRSVQVPSVIALALAALSFACSPVAAPPTPAPTADPFAVVRATAQAAYATGKAQLDSGNYLQACINLDAARTNDPDNRPEIQQALQQALQYCLTPPPEATAVPVAASQRTLVVATLAVQLAGTPTAAPGGTARSVSTPAAGALATSTSAAPFVTPTPIPASALTAWNDPQGRFTISAPQDWTRTDNPPTLFGSGVVGFRDPGALAELSVAVDSAAKAVSPELYSASMDLAMQQQMPGYAGEQVMPGNTSGNPSLRRVFTFTQKDAAGRDHQARGFQVTVVKGSTPYIISGSAPAEQYEQYSTTFDQIVQTFRFS